jgi:glycosyltransferase involved in cell wall biosynthesis
MELPTLKDKDEIKKELDIDKNNLVIIFHGSHFHPPNREAIDLIKNDIAPEIMKVDKDIVFVIAGFDVPVFEEENIKSVGYVADIYSLIHAADMAIVPILSGGGTKLKVLDYMGVGLPIVTTKKGIEGINAKNGEDAIIVGDVNAKFTDAIKYLIDNKQEREKIGANARKLAEEEYDWDKIGEKLDNLYREILEGKRHANN